MSLHHSPRVARTISRIALAVALAPSIVAADRASVRAAPLPPKQRINAVFKPVLPALTTFQLGAPMLPTIIPGQYDGSGRLYAQISPGDVSLNAYIINLGYTPTCDGATACRLGTVTGGFTVETPQIMEYPHGHPMTVRGHVKALFFPAICGGAGCSDAVVVWEQDGVSYTVGLKGGTQRDVVAMANSVVPVQR